ncbi:MAG: T9SS type A sorting domain-containing protein, partial [Hymenobacteraceae bacterium]|nr:T9SS type A sorting domain-containing protein [Hymenobacteraceae bacterium]MDX5397456.1 T9SS type A sorting domain-containing protein [Hymenobacteraceae bacterium]MDX5513534.1 T9SS type A sorting domain-containing protein [Hymenobacteraceae bacterium]
TTIQIIVASRDPNDKQVLQQTLTPEQVKAEQHLDYIIRFQNTGTDTAFTVIVRDVLPHNLNIASLQTTSASHPFSFSINKNGVAEWRFNNILLPDSNTNELLSHGYMRFRIKPDAALQIGDSISNSAEIYFDYNAAVITNKAVTVVQPPVSDKNKNIQYLYLYPNPAADMLTVNAGFNSSGPATIRILNVLGQVVYKTELTQEQRLVKELNIEGFSKGMYLVQVQYNGEMVTKRVVFR